MSNNIKEVTSLIQAKTKQLQQAEVIAWQTLQADLSSQLKDELSRYTTDLNQVFENSISEIKTAHNQQIDKLTNTISDQQTQINSLIEQLHQSQRQSIDQLRQVNGKQMSETIAELSQWQQQTASDIKRISYLPPTITILTIVVLFGAIVAMVTIIFAINAYKVAIITALILIVVMFIAAAVAMVIRNKEEE